MTRWIILAIALASIGGCYFRAHRPADWDGRPAPEPPRQSSTDLPHSWSRGEYHITPLARFSARTVVLSRCNYSGGHDSELAQTDFALGWSRLSEAAIINAIKVRQDMRWYLTAWKSDLAISGEEVARSSANMHLIPASEEIARELRRVKRHDILELSGYLVEASHRDGWKWRSSLRRDDTGNGACEVVWVEKVNRASPRDQNQPRPGAP